MTATRGLLSSFNDFTKFSAFFVCFFFPPVLSIIEGSKNYLFAKHRFALILLQLVFDKLPPMLYYLAQLVALLLSHLSDSTAEIYAFCYKKDIIFFFAADRFESKRPAVFQGSALARSFQR